MLCLYGTKSFQEDFKLLCLKIPRYNFFFFNVNSFSMSYKNAHDWKSCHLCEFHCFLYSWKITKWGVPGMQKPNPQAKGGAKVCLLCRTGGLNSISLCGCQRNQSWDCCCWSFLVFLLLLLAGCTSSGCFDSGDQENPLWIRGSSLGWVMS